MKVIVYADFNCVYCFLASQRADRLTREGTAEVDWRAVEHLPRLPVTATSHGQARLSRAARPGRDDLAEAAQLAPAGEQLPAGTFTWFTPRRRAATEYELYTVGQQSNPGQWLHVGWPIRFDDGREPYTASSTAIRCGNWAGYRDPAGL